MQSLSAIDYFMPSYIVWGGIITALSELGYDPDEEADKRAVESQAKVDAAQKMMAVMPPPPQQDAKPEAGPVPAGTPPPPNPAQVAAAKAVKAA
jgi:hypothetical protein